MRSQTIKIRNIPDVPPVQKTVSVKPSGLIALFLTLGMAFLFLRTYMALAGLFLIMMATFALVIMPDRKLAEFTLDYLILYNCKARDECRLLYWDEIVAWQYEYHTSYDRMEISMVDGSTEAIEMFSRRSVAPWMEKFAAGKERKNPRTRKAGA
jgi:hypothetical protein